MEPFASAGPAGKIPAWTPSTNKVHHMNLSLQRVQPGLPRQSCCPVVHPKRHWGKKSPHLGCLCRVLKISLSVATSITKCFTTCVPSSSHLDRSSLQWTLGDSISVSILLSNLLLSCIMSPLRLETDAEGSPSPSIDNPDTRLMWGFSAFGSPKVLALGESARKFWGPMCVLVAVESSSSPMLAIMAIVSCLVVLSMIP